MSLENIRYVCGVSYPRCGHHLLEWCLVTYFGEDFRYCNGHARQDWCCGTLPCSTPQTTHFSKSHDTGTAKVDKVEGVPYLIQVRHFYNSFLSTFRVLINRERMTEDPADFEKLINMNLPGYRKFMEKWVMDDNINSLVMPYERLIGAPHAALTDIFEFCAPGAPVDPDRVDHLVQNANAERNLDKSQKGISMVQGAGIGESDHAAEMKKRYIELGRKYEDKVADLMTAAGIPLMADQAQPS